MSAKILTFCLLLWIPVSILSAGQAPSDKESQINLHASRAQQYLREKRPDLALPELQVLAALDPDNAEVRGNLGVLLFFRGDYKEAVPQLKAALKLQPDLWKLQALLGLAESKLGDNDASREDLESAFPHLTEEKLRAEVGQALISEYAASGDLEKAATVASTLLASRPTDELLLYTSYRLYSDLAGKTMLTLALTAPDSAEMHQVMARELARHGDDSAAITNYREAIKIDQNLPGLHSELGDLLYHSSDTKLQAEAESELKAALTVNSRDVQAELILGLIAGKRGDTNAAYAHFSHALEIDPNDGDACTELAKLLVTMNKREEAQQMFERAVQIDPTNFTAHFRLSTLYREAGKTEAAKQQVAEYLKYKQMKSKLEKIFHDMRVPSGQLEDDDENHK
jgi:Tfp pilus assembly protein PilF